MVNLVKILEAFGEAEDGTPSFDGIDAIIAQMNHHYRDAWDEYLKKKFIEATENTEMLNDREKALWVQLIQEEDF
jgi:hypothetical protein